MECCVGFHPQCTGLFTETTHLEVSGRVDFIPLEIMGVGIGPTVTVSNANICIGEPFILTRKSCEVQYHGNECSYLLIDSLSIIR